MTTDNRFILYMAAWARLHAQGDTSRWNLRELVETFAVLGDPPVPFEVWLQKMEALGVVPASSHPVEEVPLEDEREARAARISDVSIRTVLHGGVGKKLQRDGIVSVQEVPMEEVAASA